MTALSKIIYYVANPLLMPLYTLLLLFQIQSATINIVPPNLKLFLYIFTFVICALFPLMSIVGLKYTRSISSIHLREKEERIVPYVLTIIYYCIAYYMLRYKFGVDYLIPAPVFSSLLGAIVAISLVSLINIKTKISAHSVGISGVLATFIAAGNKYYTANTFEISLITFGLMLLVGLTATSRLWLKAHTERQVYSGLLLGFIVEYIFVSYDIII
jgi:hypothetical protein